MIFRNYKKPEEFVKEKIIKFLGERDYYFFFNVFHVNYSDKPYNLNSLINHKDQGSIARDWIDTCRGSKDSEKLPILFIKEKNNLLIICSSWMADKLSCWFNLPYRMEVMVTDYELSDAYKSFYIYDFKQIERLSRGTFKSMCLEGILD